MNSEVTKKNSLWVFGYGSLCWNPGFKHSGKLLGFIRGYSRRFWQGNNAHRGTVEKPGRVATLVEDDQETTWGIAYELSGDAALKYLEERECTLGGYRTIFTQFFSRNGVAEPFPVLLYVATPDNSQWLGPAQPMELAKQISECRGPAGHNVEYVILLANFMRENLPEVHDEHLFTLEELLKQILRDKNTTVEECIRGNVQAGQMQLDSSAAAAVPIIREAQHAEDGSPRGSPKYQSRLDAKNLRCVKP